MLSLTIIAITYTITIRLRQVTNLLNVILAQPRAPSVPQSENSDNGYAFDSYRSVDVEQSRRVQVGQDPGGRGGSSDGECNVREYYAAEVAMN